MKKMYLFSYPKCLLKLKLAVRTLPVLFLYIYVCIHIHIPCVHEFFNNPFKK